MDETSKVSLYPYQQIALDFHLRAKYSICGFQMGLGKTPLAISFLDTVGGDCIVVCPAYLKQHWADEIKKFSNKNAKIEIQSYAKIKIKAGTRAVIFDEIHYLKNIKAKRTISAHEQVMLHKPDYLLGLSGTPIKNAVWEWWANIRLCSYGNPDIGMGPMGYDFKLFCETFSNPVLRTVRGFNFTQYKGIKNADKLRELVAPMYYRKKAEGLPERVSRFVAVDCEDAKHLEFQEQLRKDFIENNSFSTAKKQNAILKVPYTIQMMEEFKEEGTRAIIFTDHVESCKLISDHFKCAALHGGTPINVRVDAAKSFERGFGQFLVCTIGAMSTGFSLTSAHHCIFNDLPFVPGDLAQAEARIRRITQKETCFYHYVFSSDIDQIIYKTLQGKIKTLEEATSV